MMEFIKPNFDNQISLVLNKIPQLKEFDHKNLIQMMQLRNKEAIDTLKENIVGLLVHPVHLDTTYMMTRLECCYKRMEINTWKSCNRR